VSQSASTNLPQSCWHACAPLPISCAGGKNCGILLALKGARFGWALAASACILHQATHAPAIHANCSMNFTRLRYFQKVAELQSLRRAAELLHVSQPALSRQIQVLEREIGCKLFLRVNKRISLTPAGHVLLTRADRLLGEIASVLDEIKRLHDDRRNRLAIGAVQSTLGYVVPRAIDELRKRYPKLQIAVHGFRSSQIIERVARGEIDIGIVALPVNDPRVESEPIAIDPFVAVVSTVHPLARLRVVTLAQVLAEPLITFPRGLPIRDAIGLAAAEAGLPLPISVELESVEAIKALVRANVGVTLLPNSTMLGESLTSGLAAVRIDHPRLVREIVAVQRLAETPSPAMKDLLQAIRWLFAGEPRGGPMPVLARSARERVAL
jgi:DNA-binding transcriptional LysR family regulator